MNRSWSAGSRPDQAGQSGRANPAVVVVGDDDLVRNDGPAQVDRRRYSSNDTGVGRPMVRTRQLNPKRRMIHPSVQLGTDRSEGFRQDRGRAAV